MSIILYKDHYEVYIKGMENPILISHDWWNALKLSLQNNDCPPFVQINNWLYNRFEIAKVVPASQSSSMVEEMIANLPNELKNKVRQKVRERQKENLALTEWVIQNIIKAIT